MKCEEVQDILSEYLDGEIAESWRREWVEKHLAGCAACRALFSELKQVRESIRSLPMTPAPKEMTGELAAKVEEIVVSSGAHAQEMRPDVVLVARVSLYRRAIPILMAAAASVLVLFVALQVRSWKQEERGTASELKVAATKSAPASPEETTVRETKESAETAKLDEAGAKAEHKPAAGFAVAEAPAAAPAAQGGPGVAADRALALAPASPAAPATPAPPEAPALAKGGRADRGQAGLDERIPAQVKEQLGKEAERAGALGQAAPAAPAPAQPDMAKAKDLGDAARLRQGQRRAEPLVVGKSGAEPARAEEPNLQQPAVKDLELAEKVVQPSIRPDDALRGMIEKKTLLLRVEDVPAASADVKGILARCGAQMSWDYYDKGLEDAGRRIRAKVPGSRYQTLLTELRKKKYLAPEVAKPSAKIAAKSAQPEKNRAVSDTVIDLTINFQASVAPPAAAAEVRPAEKAK